MMSRTTPQRRRRKLKTFIAALAGLTVVPLLAGGGGQVETVGAGFTAHAQSPELTVQAGALEQVPNLKAHRGTLRQGHVTWDTPSGFEDDELTYTIEGTIGDQVHVVEGITGNAYPDDLRATISYAPKKIDNLQSGMEHTCALAEGWVYCWGSHYSRQIGRPSTWAYYTEPVGVDKTHNQMMSLQVTDLAVGMYHSCAIANGWPYCWGRSSSYQSGENRFQSANRPMPAWRGEMEGKITTGIAAGNTHSCAIADGEVYCWGGAQLGQLGAGELTENAYVQPHKVHLPPGVKVVDISLGSAHSCALTDNGLLYCWGDNTSQQTGTGSNANALYTPQLVLDSGGTAPLQNVAAVATTHAGTCAQTFDTQLGQATYYCWGNADDSLAVGQPSADVRPLPTIVDISAAPALRAGVQRLRGMGNTMCALPVNGEGAYCWGAGMNYQLGHGIQENRATPVRADFSEYPGQVSAIAPGGNHSCAVIAELPYCWGSPDRGVLGGTDTVQSHAVPVQMRSGLGTKHCDPGWVMDFYETYCAPGRDMTITYRITYEHAGWTSPYPEPVLATLGSNVR